jgi:hypothetical protein
MESGNSPYIFYDPRPVPVPSSVGSDTGSQTPNPPQIKRRRERQLPETKYIDEVVIRPQGEGSSSHTLIFHICLQEKFKESYASGSTWRFSASCKVKWNDKVVAKWVASSVEEMAFQLPMLFDQFLHDTPRTRTDQSSFSMKDRNEFIEYVESKIPMEVEFIKKGRSFYTNKVPANRNVLSAILYADYIPIEYEISPNEKEQKQKEEDRNYWETLCFQPGCPNKATVEFTIKKLYFDGDELKQSESSTVCYYRRFCEGHRKRGDQNDEDRDSNYELYTGIMKT